jgi:hypothetical protein
MKGNDGSGNNEERDFWQTNQELWLKLDKQYLFTFDCCATADNSKTIMFSSDFEETNSVMMENDNCWMNPPFSKAKEMFEHFFKVVSKGVTIYRCDNMETKIWQEVILPNCSWIFIPNKRIPYEGMIGSGSRFPSALIGYNVLPPQGFEGVLLKVRY